MFHIVDPFQIKVSPLETEYLFPNSHNCPNLKSFLIKLHTTLSKNCDHTKDLDFLEKNLSYKRSFISFFDDIQARQVDENNITKK